MWSAEEFEWKVAGLLAGNTKGFIYLESKVYPKGKPSIVEFVPYFQFG